MNEDAHRRWKCDACGYIFVYSYNSFAPVCRNCQSTRVTIMTEQVQGTRHNEQIDDEALELLPYDGLCRIGRHLNAVVKSGKYDRFNWEKGLPVDQTMRRLLHHAFKYLSGDRSEDHLAAIGCNTFFAMRHENDTRWAKNLRPPKELGDD